MDDHRFPAVARAVVGDCCHVLDECESRAELIEFLARSGYNEGLNTLKVEPVGSASRSFGERELSGVFLELRNPALRTVA